MLTREEAKQLTDKIFSYGRKKINGKKAADEIEVILLNYNQSLTRYANNVITQNVHESEITDLTVRLIKGGKVARAATNKLDDESLKKLISDTAELVSYQKADRKMLPLPKKQVYREVDAYVEKTGQVSPHDRTESIRMAVGECEKHGLNGSGIFSNGVSCVAIANSHGLFAYHKGSEAEFSLTALTNDSSGWAKAHHKDASHINTLAVARQAIDKALKSQNPVSLPAGHYTVILEPAAVSNFMLFMALRGLGALTFQEGRSFLSGKMCKQVMGGNISIMDNVYHPQAMGAPFDFEGMPKKEVVLIEKGIAKNVVYDRETALKAKTVTTGHGLPQPNAYGPMPTNLILGTGDSSIDEMIGSTKKGVLVTEFHYTNLVEPMQLVLTGMTRNGTFLIENGQITKGIKNMRFTESVVKALSNVEMISRESKYQNAFFGGGFVVPELKINDFNFSSETKF